MPDFYTIDSDGHRRYVLPDGKIGPRVDIFELTFAVDKRVNVDKDKTLEEALVLLVPESDRDLVRAEYTDWHRRIYA